MEVDNPHIFFPGVQSTLNREFERQLKSQLSYRPKNQVNESSSPPFSSDSDDDMSGLSVSGGNMEYRFHSEKVVYSDQLKKRFDMCEIRKGATFDILSLLSKPYNNANHLVRIRNGQIQGDEVVQVDCLKGKFILLCCVLVPQLVDGSYAGFLQKLSLLSRELCVRSDVEMVLVVKVRPLWSSDYQSVARQFVSTMSCLAVPFDHLLRVDSICMCLNMGAKPIGLFVDPNQVVIQDTLLFVYGVGIDAFPFTDSNIRSNRSGIKKMKSLEQLLASNVPASPYRIRNGKHEVASISELRQKLVGLYLHITGDDLSMLKNVYRQCQARGLEFEVVVFCMPFDKTTTPDALDGTMARILDKRKLPWWVFPFNTTVFHRLHIRSRSDISDRLFIVLPNGKLMEPQGELVTRHFGVDAYPFTRETVIKKALDKLRGLTLESCLQGGFLYRGGDLVSVDHLRGRNVILWLDWLDGDIGLYLLIRRYYYHLKARDPQMEVVFVCLDTRITNDGKLCLYNMPWLAYVRDPSKSGFVPEGLFLWGMEHEKLVAFGKDGRISSIHVEHKLSDYGPAAFPFCGNLVEEICDEMDSKDSQLMYRMVWSDDTSLI